LGFVLFGVVSVLVVIPFWKIFEKAGFPPVLSLLMLVPVANIVAVCFVAFSAWPGLGGRAWSPGE
jgi:hypothetical protein